MARIYVKGYTKPNGTKVKGHYRDAGLGKSMNYPKYIDAEKALTTKGYKVIGGNPMLQGVALLGPKKQKAAIKKIGAAYKTVVYK